MVFWQVLFACIAAVRAQHITVTNPYQYVTTTPKNSHESAGSAESDRATVLENERVFYDGDHAFPHAHDAHANPPNFRASTSGGSSDDNKISIIGYDGPHRHAAHLNRDHEHVNRDERIEAPAPVLNQVQGIAAPANRGEPLGRKWGRWQRWTSPTLFPNLFFHLNLYLSKIEIRNKILKKFRLHFCVAL